MIQNKAQRSQIFRSLNICVLGEGVWNPEATMDKYSYI